MSIRCRPVFLVITLLATSTALAQGLGNGHGSPMRALPQTSVEGSVSSIQGAVVGLLGGTVLIDVSEAKIVGVGHNRAEESGNVSIAVGSWVSASVEPPDSGPAPVPGASGALTAKFVVVTKYREGSISGPVQSVDTALSTFKVLGRDVKVSGQTEFEGKGADDAKGLSGLAAGDQVSASVVVSSGSLLAVRVTVHPDARHELVTFTGAVEATGASAWTVSGRTVEVNGETRFVGSPQKGDAVQVLARHGDGPALVALSIAKLSGNPGAAFSFRGKVESVPAGGLGLWTIGGRGVVVNAATRLQGHPGTGDQVDAKGFMEISPTSGGPASFQMVATEIEKKGHAIRIELDGR